MAKRPKPASAPRAAQAADATVSVAGTDPARDRHDLFDPARHGAFVFVHLRVLREKLPVHGSGRAALGLYGLTLELDPV